MLRGTQGLVKWVFWVRGAGGWCVSMPVCRAVQPPVWAEWWARVTGTGVLSHQPSIKPLAVIVYTARSQITLDAMVSLVRLLVGGKADAVFCVCVLFTWARCGGDLSVARSWAPGMLSLACCITTYDVPLAMSLLQRQFLAP